MTYFQKITVKDIERELGVGRTAASKYYADIKKEYNLTVVLFCHFIDYFKVPKNTEINRK